MFHIVAHTVPNRRLFRSWEEGFDLWRLVLRVEPHPEALCLMPDHLHLISRHDLRAPLGRALGGWARHRNTLETRRGALIEPVPIAHPLVGRDKVRRNIRYVHLNPCRAFLVDDPLAWPLSTHRDALGYSWPPVGPRRSRRRFHAYVSADPSVAECGSPLPAQSTDEVEVDRLLAVLSTVTRTPICRLGRDLCSRPLAVYGLRHLAGLPQRQVASVLGISRGTVQSCDPPPVEAQRTLAHVAADPRFGTVDARHSNVR